jgi:hypothetical protein
MFFRLFGTIKSCKNSDIAIKTAAAAVLIVQAVSPVLSPTRIALSLINYIL